MKNVWILSGITVLFLLINTSYSFGETSNISATVQLSVCGNNIKEGGEDCDGADFGSNGCSHFGFSHGILDCDHSCSADTSLCVRISPTMTPTTTPSPSNISAITSTPTPAPQNTNTPIPTVINPVVVEENTVPVIMSKLLSFDFNKDGVLQIDELYAGLTVWVKDWKRSRENARVSVNNLQCDLNDDNVCNLRDFSIYLYYFQ